MRSLEQHALGSLVDQILVRVGDNARVVAPGGALTPLDGVFVGVLKTLLLESFPGTPDALLSSLQEGLIVIARPHEEDSQLVTLGESRLRVGKEYWPPLKDTAEYYANALNMHIVPTRYQESDLRDPHFVFHDKFFRARSIKGWAKLSAHFARLCALLDDVKTLSGLKQQEVFHSERDTHLVYALITNSAGEELTLDSE